MKKIILIVTILLSLSSNAQQTDILFTPNQSSLVTSYNFRQIGWYVGGTYITTNPQPFIYTTPRVIINRAGLTYVNEKNTFSIMGGGFITHNALNIEIIPDIWLKIYPIRMIKKDKSSMDFSFGLNYSNGFGYGIGLSIPFSSIYNR
jgi:hypothetical protein